MPALPAVAKVLRVDLFQSTNGNTRVLDRVFFSFTGAGPTVTDLNSLATTIANAWGSNMASQVTTGAILIGVKITDLTSATGAQVFLTTSKPGTSGGTNAADGSAMVIRFKIARRYRGGHPRFYLCGWPVSDLTSGVAFSAATGSNVATAFTNFIAACVLTPPTNLGTLQHVNVSYFTGFHNVTMPSGRSRSVATLRSVPTTDAILSYSVNLNVASQRRRNLQSA